jgi:hypothetical protein
MMPKKLMIDLPMHQWGILHRELQELTLDIIRYKLEDRLDSNYTEADFQALQENVRDHVEKLPDRIRMYGDRAAKRRGRFSMDDLIILADMIETMTPSDPYAQEAYTDLYLALKRRMEIAPRVKPETWF